MKKIREQTTKLFFTTLGFFFVLLGMIGVLMPMLPGTIFFILAGFCFVRGSEKFYQKLIENRHVGEHVKNFMEKRAMPLRAKYISLSMMWSSLTASFVVTESLLTVKIILFLVAIFATTYIISLNTIRD